MKKNVAIVHYNTPELTEAVVLSLRKHTPDCSVTVFDNSNEKPFVQMDGVKVIDNTKGQIIDFDKWLASYPAKIPTACDWGSEKHIVSVEMLYNLISDGFVLLDSDALIKRDITPLFDASVAWVGEIERHPQFDFQAMRLYPFILWINVPMCKKAGIHFMREGRIYKVSHTGAPYYDTAGSFFWDCEAAGLHGREIVFSDYVVHLHAGSHHRSEAQIANWLHNNRDLYL